MRLSSTSPNHDFLYSFFSFYHQAVTLTATTAVHVHMKPYLHHATAAFDIAPSEPAANIQCLKKPVKCFVLFDCLRNISRTRKDKSI
jgi:hypothetical protein